MANQYATTRVFERFPSHMFGYSHPALCFERDSIPSGLYGPVQVNDAVAGV